MRYRFAWIDGRKTWIEEPDTELPRRKPSNPQRRRTTVITAAGERELLLDRIDAARREGRGVR